MHVLALMAGGCLHILGDIMLCIVSVVIAGRLSGHVYDDYYEFPSRTAAAFELLPIPIGLSIAGLILARWGVAGL